MNAFGYLARVLAKRMKSATGSDIIAAALALTSVSPKYIITPKLMAAVESERTLKYYKELLLVDHDHICPYYIIVMPF